MVPHFNRWAWLCYAMAVLAVVLTLTEAYRRANKAGWTTDLISGHQRNMQQARKEETAQTRADNEALRRALVRANQRAEAASAAAARQVVTTGNTNWNSVNVVGTGNLVTVHTNQGRVQRGSQTVTIMNGDYHCDCAAEHWATVTIMNGDYIAGCNAEEPPVFPTSIVRDVTIMQGDYICPCERSHGGLITITNGDSRCQ